MADTCAAADRDEEPNSERFASGLPQTVLCEILALACADGAVPTAAVVACVCSAWREASRVAAHRMWRDIDCSFGWCKVTDKIIGRLAASGAWAYVNSFSLSGCATVSDAGLVALRSCGRLTRLDVSRTTRFSSHALVALCGAAPLRSLSLASLSTSPVANMDKTLAACVDASSATLTHLSLAGCRHLSGGVLASLSRCASLSTLDLTSGSCVGRRMSLPVEALQAGAPLLEVLKLSGLGLDSGWEAARARAGRATGWPRLKEAWLRAGVRQMNDGVLASASGVDDAGAARSFALLRFINCFIALIRCSLTTALPSPCLLQCCTACSAARRCWFGSRCVARAPRRLDCRSCRSRRLWSSTQTGARSRATRAPPAAPPRGRTALLCSASRAAGASSPTRACRRSPPALRLPALMWAALRSRGAASPRCLGHQNLTRTRSFRDPPAAVTRPPRRERASSASASTGAARCPARCGRWRAAAWVRCGMRSRGARKAMTTTFRCEKSSNWQLTAYSLASVVAPFPPFLFVHKAFWRRHSVSQRRLSSKANTVTYTLIMATMLSGTAVERA